MKCVAGHQANLYPYGGFFAKFASVDTFVIVDNTQYVKKQYHNRNQILLLDGRRQWLTIPVHNAGHFKQKINEVEIDNSSNWQKRHLKTLAANYSKAPFFNQFYPSFELLLSKEWQFLFDFNKAFIDLCLQILEIDTSVLIASAENISGKSTNLILDICKKTNSNAYLHGKHAKDYVEFDVLTKAGITNLIQEFSSMEYPQRHECFMPNLSIIDILFNCGYSSMSLLLQGQKIIKQKCK